MSDDLRSALNLLETACLSNESDMSTVNAYRVAVDNGIADLRAHVARLEDSLRVALAARAEALEVLGEVEWGNTAHGRRWCPVCSGTPGTSQADGHAPDCRLARVLGKGR